MISKAIEHISELARRAAEPKAIHPPWEPDHVYGVTNPDGSISWREAELPPPVIQAYSLEDFNAALAALPFASGLAVFCGRGMCVAASPWHSREQIAFEMRISDEFATLTALRERRQKYAQAAFVDLLRIDLNGVVPEEFLLAVRNLRFTTNNAGHSAVATGKESISRTLERELHAGDKPVPDEVTLTVCVYRDLALDELRHEIRCAVSADLGEATFTLTPMSGELERAQRETDAWVKAEIAKAGPESLFVMCGSPDGDD